MDLKKWEKLIIGSLRKNDISKTANKFEDNLLMVQQARRYNRYLQLINIL